jgi:YHS domain-containing protein
MKRLFPLAATFALVLSLRADHDGSPHKVLVSRDKENIALQGHDPVAYFTDNKPVKGVAQCTAGHQGAVYHFATPAHRDMFVSDPGRYAPAFGGYCGYAASVNRLSPISPEWFQIIDGRLILQHNRKAFDLWNKDLQEDLKKATFYWPGLVERNGTGGGKLLLNLDRKGVALEGHDPVAYFTQNKAVRGLPQFEATYNGALYHFASEDNRVTFENNPATYAPQFGGYCGYAASLNKLAGVDPGVFQILDGRLVLQNSTRALAKWNKDLQDNLSKADRHWSGLVEKHGK